MYPLNIIEDTDDYLVVYKPRGIHSAPLSKSDGDSALSRILVSYPEVGTVHGKNPVEGGLIHRIDKETEGLLLCAKNQDFYDYMDACQKKGVFFKEYIALCDVIPRYSELMAGFPPCSEGHWSAQEGADTLISTVKSEILESTNKPMILKSYFRPYGPGRKAVRPVTGEAGKYAEKKRGDVLYRTECIKLAGLDQNNVESTGEAETKSAGFQTAIFKARIHRGYRHQVRCHLAWAGYPVRGDVVYNPIAIAQTDNTGKICHDSKKTTGAEHSNQGSGTMNRESGDFEMLFYAVVLEFPLKDGSLKHIDVSSPVLQRFGIVV